MRRKDNTNRFNTEQQTNAYSGWLADRALQLRTARLGRGRLLLPLLVLLLQALLDLTHRFQGNHLQNDVDDAA